MDRNELLENIASLLSWTEEESIGFRGIHLADAALIVKTLQGCKAALESAEGRESVPKEWRDIVEAVAHIGIDFGFGTFELNESHIQKARKLLEPPK